eukprot:6442012-Amphidinium_carterae.8
MAPNVKFDQRNQQQRYEAIWIGRDTITGQHITLTPELIWQTTIQNCHETTRRTTDCQRPTAQGHITHRR